MSAVRSESRPARADDLPAVVALLAECGLPTGDLSASHLDAFRLVLADGRLVGVGGVEPAGDAGLLRSVADYADLPAIVASGREARAHGFDGATCVHPSVVPVLNAAFSPSPEETAWAGRVVEAAKTSGGAFTVDGRMVDSPVIARARRILGL